MAFACHIQRLSRLPRDSVRAVFARSTRGRRLQLMSTTDGRDDHLTRWSGLPNHGGWDRGFRSNITPTGKGHHTAGAGRPDHGVEDALHRNQSSYASRVFEGSLLGMMLVPFMCWLFAVGMVILYLNHFFTLE